MVCVVPNDRRYRLNLAALERFQPEVAALVEATPIPDGAVPATGRDGGETFLITDESGTRRWFGGSSMPSISVAEVFADFESDGSNVSLPGILTGLEPLVTAGKSPAHCAVFVIEEDALNLKLAMHLYDYADLMETGRLVVIAGADLTESLCTFYRDHPGYTLPSHLIRVPQRMEVEMAELQRRLEGAGEAVAQLVTQAMQSHRNHIARLSRGPLSDVPRIAVVGLDPRPIATAQTVGVVCAVETLDWPCESSIPDGPSRCHTLAHLRTVERLEADLVLVVNGLATELRSLLPPDLPVVSWFQSSYAATLPEQFEQKLGPHDVAIAPSVSFRDRLVQAGLPSSAVEVCDVAVDETTYRPIAVSSEDDRAFDTEVAVLMDVPDDRPEAFGVNLASHLALWSALQAGVGERPDRYAYESAAEFLGRAEKASGTILREASIRGHFVGLLRASIAPARIAHARVDALLADGHTVNLWGSHWQPREKWGNIRRGAIPGGE
ncbi:MAG: hypothetical protein IID43_04175, partial [Planctomycetes bacterium]|nr:hypothetical protein [Planctomycetota bacterium]